MTHSTKLKRALCICVGAQLVLCVALSPAALAQDAPTQQEREAAAKARQQQMFNEPKGGAFLQAEENSDRNIDAPKEVFNGCDAPKSAAGSAPSPRDRISGGKQDVIKQRSFAGTSLDEMDQSQVDDEALDCWYRIDGVWRQESVITLDKSKNPTEWYSKEPDILTLANGNYTTPMHIYVETFEGTDEKIAIRAALHANDPIVVTSTDGVALKDALTRGGPRKVYKFAGPGASKATEIVIGMTRTGRIRLSYAGHTFVRPKPGVSQVAAEEQLRSDDAFLLSYNLKNLKANRQGYDVVTQDAFRLLDSDKLPVFAEVDLKQYKISEQQIVPVGLTLIQENTQGTIYARSLITSQTQYQKTIGHSFGASVEVSASNPSQTASASTSVGFNYTKEQTEGMRSSSAEMQAMGFSRSKRYAMVVDHPYVTLSNPFIEAIDDARYTGNYARIVERFGTHYAYAVTYGSVGKLTQRFNKTEIADFMANNESHSFNAVVSVSNYEKSLQNSDTAQENENWTFVALGGNGSWDQGGFSTGDTPYPILLDLRPLDELLNPMNFPGEPKVYEQARAGLRAAIEKYMESKNNLLSAESVLPEIEGWELKVTQLICGSAGSEADSILELAGNLFLNTLSQPESGPFPPKKYLFSANFENARALKCPKGRWNINYAKRFYGTRQQLNQYRFRFRSELIELDYAGIFDPDDEIKGNSPNFGVPSSATPVGGIARGKGWRLPPGAEGTHLGLHWTFTRIR